LDGYIAGPKDEGERLHEWVFGGEPDSRLSVGHYPKSVTDADVLAELFATTGAVLMGRRTFDLHEKPWGENPPFHVPCFVLSHREREKLIKDGGTTFTFVTEGIKSAMAQAHAAAGEKNVSVLGGASLASQCIHAGLVDDIQIHLVPVLLGEGIRLFDRPSSSLTLLESTGVVASPSVTHLRFRVVKEETTPQKRVEKTDHIFASRDSSLRKMDEE
jgi:dihydrofolate reductase